MARYPINRSMSVRVNLQNALDKHYYSSTSGSTYYGMPRALRLALSVDF